MHLLIICYRKIINLNIHNMYVCIYYMYVTKLILCHAL